ncbi:MAG: IS3 family transposase [Acidobacteria bacterium]|nr:IS3 family transposase [Acidobacteriota bacterium]
MTKQRNHYSADFKAKVAIAAIKGQQTVNEIASIYSVHPNQVMAWKKQVLETVPDIFSARRVRAAQDDEELKAQLYQQIGQLKVELDWLKKKAGDCSVDQKRQMVEPEHEQISVRRQCEMLGFSRTGLYYKERGESAENLALMRRLDEQYTCTPFYGVERMTAWLRAQGYEVNQKRVRRLLREMGLEAIYPKPRLSDPQAGHRIYPYLLKGVRIERVNQVWSTDITYIRLRQGLVYLVAVLDWHSRYVLAWEVSVSLESCFCVSALDSALSQGQPETFNSDQGSQFTSEVFSERLVERGIQISMDGRGRALDNIVVERLWRSVKYEEVYLKDYGSVAEAMRGLRAYFEFYNHERPHQSLNYKTPAAVYRQGQTRAAFTTLN